MDAMEAIVARRRAAGALEAACKAIVPEFVGAFAEALTDPIPDDLRRIVRVAERRLRQ